MNAAVQYGFGLELLSDIQVPGAIQAAPGHSRGQVRISLAEPAAIGKEPQFELDGEAIIYRHPVGDFRCEADGIAVVPVLPLDLDDLGAVLVANALPAVLWLRGGLVVHAACVRFPDGLTIAIAGPSGSGKSRLAAGLVGAGAELIGDDSLSLSEDNGKILAAGLPGGWFARQGDGGAREFHSVEPGPAVGMAQIDVFVVLDAARPDQQSVSALEALELLMQHRHRPQVPFLLGMQAQGLATAARIARNLPLFRLGPCVGSEQAVIDQCAELVRLARQVACDRGLRQANSG